MRLGATCLDPNYSTTRLLSLVQRDVDSDPSSPFESVSLLPKNDSRKSEGGLRTKGYCKKSYEDRPLVSVITVVFNGETFIENTIKSVIDQTYDNVEYIIIDGGSNDGTLDIIKQYDGQIDYWVSEKDSGIYDAMNKGIQTASGVWLNFMNAGDTFVGDEVLEAIDLKKYSNIALLYGNKIDNEKVIYPHDISELEYGIIMACHQSMFFNKLILKNELKYDLTLPIYGDYELVNKIYARGFDLKYMDLNISIFEGGGISSFISAQKRKDKYKTLYKYYGIKGVLRGILYWIGRKINAKK